MCFWHPPHLQAAVWRDLCCSAPGSNPGVMFNARLNSLHVLCLMQATVTECNNAFARAFALSKCLQQRHFFNDGRRCEYNGTSLANI